MEIELSDGEVIQVLSIAPAGAAESDITRTISSERYFRMGLFRSFDRAHTRLPNSSSDYRKEVLGMSLSAFWIPESIRFTT